jgi:hypothetical protein
MRPVETFKGIGIIAGAVIAVATIVSWVSSHAWQTAINPVLTAIAAEQTSRQSADSLIVLRLKSISEDRLDLVDVMLTPPGKVRDGKLLSIRARWTRER